MSDAEAAMDPPADMAMDEEAPMMENMDDMDKKESEMDKSEMSKKEEEKKETEASEDDPTPKDNLEPCCCCLCVCSNEFTEDRSCCGCFPIKCGIVCIGIFTYLVTVILLTWNFFLFMNDYIHWWFTFVVLLLYAPLMVGAAFFVSFFTKDTKTTRSLIRTACILIIVSLCLVVIWYLIYFIWIYKRDGFYQGMGDPKDNVYTKNNKKSFLFAFLGETVLLLVCYAYFLCVTANYADAMHGPPKEEEEMMDEMADDAAKMD